MTAYKKHKICLIYTGGTIGMHRDINGTLRPPGNPAYFLEIAPELRESAEFDFVPLLNKDSANMNPGDWGIIAKTIYERRNNGYSGFVVAHGTDTMHFSASAVAFALGKNLNFPVVFTGSQTAPDVLHGDARINLLRAFKVAGTDIAEVVICFGDYVFRGCRAQKKDERRFDAFESPSFFPLAHITENIIINDIAMKRKTKNEDIDLKNDFSGGIIQIPLIPGLEPELLLHLLYDDKCKGIILQPFGAGNVPNESPCSWVDFIEESTMRGKPVLFAGQFSANATLHSSYATGKAAIDAGAVPTGNMTSACAAVKFRWALAQAEKTGSDKKAKSEKIREMMNTVYIGEFN
ncbi:MAG: asparaginase [Oscillospiraceae bacterium]|nr:asparaginase [Oscillospiraceae bacterium]